MSLLMLLSLGEMKGSPHQVGVCLLLAFCGNLNRRGSVLMMMEQAERKSISTSCTEMTEAQRYLLDLRGYIVVPNALTASQLQRANTALSTRLGQSPEWLNKSHCRMGYPTVSFDGDDGDVFRELIDNSAVMPIVRHVIGQTRVRLDHDYLDVIEPPSPGGAGTGPIGTVLHGGNHPYDPGQFYANHQGKMYNGLIVVAYSLADVGDGDGGFGCVPGSHKVNYGLPDEWRDSGEALKAGVAVAVPAPAGSAVIFTEALTHGTLPWKGRHQRRTLFFKYHQPQMAWLNYDDTGYAGLQAKDGEKRGQAWSQLLDPPYIGRACR